MKRPKNERLTWLARNGWDREIGAKSSCDAIRHDVCWVTVTMERIILGIRRAVCLQVIVTMEKILDPDPIRSTAKMISDSIDAG